MSKVLLAQEIHKDACQFLKDKGFEIEISPSPNEEVIIQHIQNVDAIIVRTATKLSRNTIFSADNLKVIARTGTGVDNVDVAAASERNIPVCNTPESNIESVAEHTMAFILALSKYLNKMDHSVRVGNFTERYSYLPIDLGGRTLGLVGFGKIGRKVAKKCSDCFDMKIMFYDPYISSKEDFGFSCVQAASIGALFENSDFISIHISYTKENRHLINKNLLARMKNTAFIINTSRGGIIEEADLAEALSGGKIAGAALDVFENEPLEADNPLLKLDNILLSPHSAALTKKSVRRTAMHAVECVADILEGKNPKWVFNRDKIKL